MEIFRMLLLLKLYGTFSIEPVETDRTLNRSAREKEKEKEREEFIIGPNFEVNFSMKVNE